MVVTDSILSKLLINKFEFNKLKSELEPILSCDNTLPKLPIIIDFNNIELIKANTLGKEMNINELIECVSQIDLHLI